MTNIKIMTENVDELTKQQCKDIMNTESFKNAQVRIMPDTHAGKGCVIGFTAKDWTSIIPDVVGVDIGCGMLVVELGKIDIDFQKLDETIDRVIPSGRNIHLNQTEEDQKTVKAIINKLNTKIHDKDEETVVNSLGTLGGGNHFIEIDEDEEGNKFLVIHTGSRKLGVLVCDFFNKTIEHQTKEKLSQERQAVINQLKAQGKEREIESTLKQLTIEQSQRLSMVNGLNKENEQKYLSDMKLTQTFAHLNRASIAKRILEAMGWKELDRFESVHNYIDFKDNVIRKGAISAHKGEKLVVPLNMRDGTILGVGKGNEDWNNSAPHGAGRVLSRSQARKQLKLDDFKKSMSQVYTTSVCEETIDEAPFVYKPADEIIQAVEETMEITKVIKPIYNFKAKN